VPDVEAKPIEGSLETCETVGRDAEHRLCLGSEIVQDNTMKVLVLCDRSIRALFRRDRLAYDAPMLGTPGPRRNPVVRFSDRPVGFPYRGGRDV